MEEINPGTFIGQSSVNAKECESSNSNSIDGVTGVRCTKTYNDKKLMASCRSVVSSSTPCHDAVNPSSRMTMSESESKFTSSSVGSARNAGSESVSRMSGDVHRIRTDVDSTLRAGVSSELTLKPCESVHGSDSDQSFDDSASETDENIPKNQPDCSKSARKPYSGVVKPGRSQSGDRKSMSDSPFTGEASEGDTSSGEESTELEKSNSSGEGDDDVAERVAGTVSASPCKFISCRNCTEKFTKPSQLDVHYKNIHNLDQPYQCWRCAYQTSEYLNMERHMDSCLEPLHCAECGDMFDNSQMLLEHKLEEHCKDPMLKIKIPNVKLVDARGNRVTRTSMRLLNSPGKRVKSYVEQDDEDEDDEPDPVVPKLRIRLPPRQRSRSKKNKAGKSVKKVQELPEPEDGDSGTLYLCPHTDGGCLYQTMVMNNLLNHLRTHDDGKVYICPHKADGCTYQTDKRGNLRSHLKTHLQFDRYKCERDGCDFRCRKKRLLSQHNKTVHGLEENKEYACDICNKKFSRSQRLKVHLRIHTNVRPFICDQCGKTFASKQWMSVHQKIHHGTEKYVCDICAKEFSAKTYLAKHVKTHDSSKKYLCDVCPKAFKRSDHLQCHKRMHTGEKPFQCTECGKTFKQICGLQAHKKVHSGEKPYVCTVCARAFTYNSSLKNGLCNSCRPFAAKPKMQPLEGLVKQQDTGTAIKFEPARQVGVPPVQDVHVPLKYEPPPNFPSANYPFVPIVPNPMDLAASAVANFMPQNM